MRRCKINPENHSTNPRDDVGDVEGAGFRVLRVEMEREAIPT